MTRRISGLGELARAYDALLCDVWGVVHDGVGAFPPACAALARWRREVGPVILISNSPRPRAPVERQLASLGAPRRAWSALVTSGDATRALLAERAPGPAWRIGPPRDRVLYRGLGLRFSGPEEARFIACTGLEDDDVETPESYRPALARAAERGLAMVCANPDRVVQRGDRLIYCGGALAQVYAELGGEVIMAGKPYSAIYEMAEAEAARRLPGLSRERILAIGDGLATDLAGARDRGLDALFIATGIHGKAALDRKGTLSLAKARRLLAGDGQQAAFVMASLAW